MTWMRRRMVVAGFISLLASTGVGCFEKPPVQREIISVGDPASEAWAKLARNGHKASSVPLDGRRFVPTPEGGSKLVSVESAYDVDGQVVLFTRDLEKNVITCILIGGRESVKSIDVSRVHR
jgi:hypothetical protein